MTTNYVQITAGSGTDIGAESLTMDSNAVWVQYVKNVLGAEDTYTAVQSGRLVDGSSSAGALFTDPRINSKDVSVTLTNSESAYTANYDLGGVIDFGAIARVSGGGVTILSATIMDKLQENAQFDLFLFNADPSNGTYTDKTAITANGTDLLMCRGVISFSAYANVGGTMSVCSIPNVGLSIVLNSTQHLYGVLVVRNAVTYSSSTSAITVALEYIAD